MKNKKKLIALACSLAALLIAGITFAFFIADDSALLSTQAGTVDVDIKAEIKHTQLAADSTPTWLDKNGNIYLDENKSLDRLRAEIANSFVSAPNNLNPGDNEDIDARPGTDHEILLTVKNLGNKSIKTRFIIEISGTTAGENSRELTKDELKNINIYFDSYNTLSGTSALHKNNYSNLENLPTVETEGNSIAYGFGQNTIYYYDESKTDPFCQEIPSIIKSNLALSGTGNNAEKEQYAYHSNGNFLTAECPTEGTFKLDIGMDLNAPEELRTANISITVKAQAMQYRNTGSKSWKEVFSETFLYHFD